MSELSGSAAVGIDRVEWSDEGTGNLVLSVTGRWRRRRPASAGQPTLVIEAEGRRHRFPAMPEPPSLAGAAPGSWRLSFTVPGWLAPSLGSAWLAVGAVVVPLPPPASAPGPAPPEHGSGTAPEERVRDVAPAEPAPLAPPEPPGPAESRAPPRPEPTGDRARLSREAAAAATKIARRLIASERELRELRDVRARHDALAAEIVEHERRRRVAEQRAHAEHELRQDLERRLSAAVRDAVRARQAMGELASAEERIRALERELDVANRRGDEAEQAVAAAHAVRERIEREQAREREERAREQARERDATARELDRQAREREERARSDRGRALSERDQRALRAASAVRIPREPDHRVAAPATDASADAELAESLREALEAQARQDATLRARLVEAEAAVAARADGERRTASALSQLRAELDSLASSLAQERRRRQEAERRAAGLERESDEQRLRSRLAYEAISDLRVAVARVPEPPEPVPPATGPTEAEQQSRSVTAIEPARLTDALARLRQTIPPPEEPPEVESPAPVESPAAEASPPTDESPSPEASPPDASVHDALARRPLEAPFRRLVRADPEAAGRLLLELLPLQWAVHPEPVAYDLVLGSGRGCVSVTSRSDPPHVAMVGSPRPRGEVDLQVVGDPARIARLLTAGRWRARFGRRTARVHGRRTRLAALSALLTTPLDLSDLRGGGVHLDSHTALALVAQLVDPAWTAQELFTLEHADPEAGSTYLLVRQGLPLTVASGAADGRVATTVECRGDELLEVLCGRAPAAATIRGDEGPLLALRAWLRRAAGS